MHVTIAVGTLLLGGWVLNTPVEQDATAVIGQTNAPATAHGSRSSLPVTAYGSQSRRAAGTTGRADERSLLRGGGERERTRSMSGSQQEGMASQTPKVMPFAPTDAATPETEGMLGQPTAPTASEPLMDASAAGAGMRGSAGSRYPMAPTMGRRSPSGSGQTSRMMSGQGRPMRQSIGGSAMMGMPAGSKPFAGYRPTSGVSPYMNLFRQDSMGTVDNYTSLVQPQLEQRFLNQRFDRDIGGLERNARTQGINLQRLNQEERTLQGVATPQFFMNSRGRFPGYGQ